MLLSIWRTCLKHIAQWSIQRHRKSLILKPIESNTNLGPILPHFSDSRASASRHRQPHFFHPHPYFCKNFGCSLGDSPSDRKQVWIWKHTRLRSLLTGIRHEGNWKPCRVALVFVWLSYNHDVFALLLVHTVTAHNTLQARIQRVFGV